MTPGDLHLSAQDELDEHFSAIRQVAVEDRLGASKKFTWHPWFLSLEERPVQIGQGKLQVVFQVYGCVVLLRVVLRNLIGAYDLAEVLHVLCEADHAQLL